MKACPDTFVSLPSNRMSVGTYTGWICPEFQHGDFVGRLENLLDLLAHPAITILSHGRDRVLKLPITLLSKEIQLTVKCFNRQFFLKDYIDQWNKSRAERSFLTAQFLCHHRIGTPEPIGYLDRWVRGRLIESYYLTLYQEAPTWRSVLCSLYHNHATSDAMLPLLQAVAASVRLMHDAGLRHGDLGNQNILIYTDANGVLHPQFIDLHRSRMMESLSWKDRAFDLSRIGLPGELLNIFKHLYCHDKDVPEELQRWEQYYRVRYSWHSRIHSWRLPIRHHLQTQAQQRKAKLDVHEPSPHHLWLWDEKSAQPCVLLAKAERHRYHNKKALLRMAGELLVEAPRLYSAYHRILEQSFRQSITLHSRCGIALHPKPNYIPHELEALHELGNPPVLIRFCHHESERDWQYGVDLVHQLRQRGISIMVAMLQSRRAVLQPDSWRHFLEAVIPSIADAVDYIEVGHAINRVKWGIWSRKEYHVLLEPAFDLQMKYKSIRITGPSCIDFEYGPVMGLLNKIPGHFGALSHHLYVDRRGAPENKQGSFSALEKCALLKAMAHVSSFCEERVIISEVNWPLKHTGVYSPVGSVYTTPSARRNPPGVEEHDYANYMIRYLTISLCSGHIERVYWWRLSAHGFGLIDDLNHWRRRSAFYAVSFFLQTLSSAHFIRKASSPDGVYIFEFQSASHLITLAWSADTPYPLPATRFGQRTTDLVGQSITPLELTQSPIYIWSELR